MAQLMPSLKNVTWKRLLREGVVTYPVDNPDQFPFLLEPT
jgi:formate dehydrogenase major subunit